VTGRVQARSSSLEHLLSLLDAENEVSAACRQALLNGARWRVHTPLVPAPQLAWIYEIREAQLREAGTATLGFAAAVEVLHSHGQRPVRLGEVKPKNSPYHFQLFLDEDLTTLLACAGTDRTDDGTSARTAG
jgi:hypothetical protein